MKIRNAKASETDRVIEIYANARRYMREQGNPTQWGDHYPSDDLIRSDIARGCSYVCELDGELVGVFYFCIEQDPTYDRIDDGAWLNDRPYGVIHRIAVAKHGCGVAKACFDYAFSHCDNIKIDTHIDNLPMQRALAKNGFLRCGTVYLENGDTRIAYQKQE